MAVTLSTAAKNAALASFKTLAETGTLFGSAAIFAKSSSTTLFFIPLGGITSSFNTPSGGTMTSFNNPVPATASNSGTLDNFVMEARDASTIMTGTIGLIGSGADIEVTGVDVVSGQLIICDQVTISIA